MAGGDWLLPILQLSNDGMTEYRDCNFGLLMGNGGYALILTGTRRARTVLLPCMDSIQAPSRVLLSRLQAGEGTSIPPRRGKVIAHRRTFRGTGSTFAVPDVTYCRPVRSCPTEASICLSLIGAKCGLCLQLSGCAATPAGVDPLRARNRMSRPRDYRLGMGPCGLEAKDRMVEPDQERNAARRAVES